MSAQKRRNGGMHMLISDTPLLVLPALAVRVGLEEGIVLQQLHYLLLQKGEPIEKTYGEWHEDVFPFLDERKLRRVFKALESAEAMGTDVPPVMAVQARGTDRRKRYWIDYEGVDQLGLEEPFEAAKLAASKRPQTADRTGQDDPDPTGQNGRVEETDPGACTTEDNDQTAERLKDEANASSLSSVRSSADAEERTPRIDATSQGPPVVAVVRDEATVKDKPGARERNELPEFVRLAELLAKQIEAATGRTPKPDRVVAWRVDIRLMVERDNVTESAERGAAKRGELPLTPDGRRDLALRIVEKAIVWSTEHEFWRTVILSGGKLRTKFPELEAQARRERPTGTAAGNAGVLARAEEKARRAA